MPDGDGSAFGWERTVARSLLRGRAREVGEGSGVRHLAFSSRTIDRGKRAADSGSGGGVVLVGVGFGALVLDAALRLLLKLDRMPADTQVHAASGPDGSRSLAGEGGNRRWCSGREPEGHDNAQPATRLRWDPGVHDPQAENLFPTPRRGAVPKAPAGETNGEGGPWSVARPAQRCRAAQPR